MPDSEAVEVQVVFKDGTVMRWEGEAAKQFWEGVIAAEAEYIDVYTTTPTTTKSKPLRKVVECVGWYVPDCDGDYIHPKEPMHDWPTMSTIVPKEPQRFVVEERTDFVGGGYSTQKYTAKYRFRFTVEAVEEKGR